LILEAGWAFMKVSMKELSQSEIIGRFEWFSEEPKKMEVLLL